MAAIAAKPYGLAQVTARLGVLGAAPAVGLILAMTIAGFVFVGLFLGEIVGLILGICFAGINLVFAWPHLVPSSLRPSRLAVPLAPQVAGPTSELWS